MASFVLILEDEQSAARLLASYCAELGLGARNTGSAREALELAAQPGCAAVLVDLVLSEQDGFQFVTAARAQPWGATLPLIVVSGVYKQLPPDFAERAKPAAFFAKPFEPAALRAALQKATGASAASPSSEVSLAKTPPAQLFIELLRTKFSGVVTFTNGDEKRALTFQQGMLRFAQSNLRAETVGTAQVAQGLIKQASFDRAVALAKQQGVPLHEALATARVLTPEQLKTALRQQTAEVALGALALSQGTARSEPRAPEQLNATPDCRVSPVAVVLDAARRSGDAGAARAWLQRRAQERLNRTPELERELFALKTSWPGESVTPLATSGRTVGEVLARVKEPELPLLQWLLVSSLLTLRSTTAAEPSAPQPVPSADDDRGRSFNPQETAARRMLYGERDHLAEASHYEVLGVPETAQAEDIRKAYFTQAKRFHSDSFAGLELGTARRVAEQLFARVNEAYSVLSDKEKRAEYDVFLDRRKKGLPTDVSAILRAEGVFQKGEALFRVGRWEDAETQFREAIALNHAEAEFHAYLGMSIFRRTGKSGDGLGHVEKALELDPRLRSGVLFAAQMHEADGDVERARTLLRKAFDKDPEFAQARDELARLRRAGTADQKKGGFFGRLLKK